MRRFVLCWAIATMTQISASPALPEIAAENGLDSITSRVREATLENGLKVLVLPVTKAPVVTLQVWYRVGSRNERLGTTGLSHLLEHLMFKETDKLKPEEFSKIIQANGGELNAFTTSDYTTYFETLSSDRLGLALELEADRMSHLKLREETTEPEKRVVMEERRLRSVDNPWGALYEETNAAAFRAHPYMWPVIGWMHDIEATTLGDISAHYQTYYRPNNAIVVVAGDVDADRTLEQVRKAFGGARAGEEAPQVTSVEPLQLGERRVFVKKEANLPALLWAYKVPNVRNADSYALEVLATVLADGESSRLYRRLVVEKRLLLDINVDNPFLSLDSNLFTLAGQVLPEKKVEDVEAALEREIQELGTKAVTARELSKAKNQIEAQFVFAQDSNFYQAMLLARFELIGDWRGLDAYLPGIRKVTAEDLQRVAREYLIPDRRTAGTLIPTGPAKHVAPPPSGMVH
ncbi:MAG: M16 family metallopeptidase [Candidatus Binatia bacterium]